MLRTIDVLQGAPFEHWIPLELWPVRENLLLGIRVERLGDVNFNDVLVLDRSAIEYSHPRPLLGVNNSSSGYSNDDDFERDPQLLKASGVKRARVFAPHNGAYAEKDRPLIWNRYWESLKRIVQTNPAFKFDLLIMQESEDYATPVKLEEIDGPYGRMTPYLPYRLVNVELFKARVENLLRLHKENGVPLEMVQLGNELDFIYSNSDIVCNPSKNSPEIQGSRLEEFVAKYAATLKITYELTKKYYPDAKVVTFGAVEGKDAWDPCHFNPIEINKRLQNVNGINYLTKFADATAVHIYAPQDPSLIKAHVESELASYTKGIPQGTPIWVTEWGFHGAFANCIFTKADGKIARNLECPERYNAIQEYLNVLNSLSSNQSPVIAANFYTFGQENSRSVNDVAFKGQMPYSLTYYTAGNILELTSEATAFRFYR